jgi:uncharacterized protein
MTHAIIWRRLDLPGHDSARLTSRGNAWHLEGTAVLAYETRPCRLDYQVVCDGAWRTQDATVTGWSGDDPVDIRLTTDPQGRWHLNGTEQPQVQGCTDVDLAFTPATNLLPIRRLALGIGTAAPVRAAWLQFPELTLAVLEQVYTRTADRTYHYASNGGAFTATLRVDAAGFVTDYENLWRVER